MPLVVQKFGGTSVGDADRIRAVADHIARTLRQGSEVVAVVSAMGKTTDDLIHLANSVSSTQPPREYDMLVSTGERISMSLLVMALADLGVEAASFTGSQVGHHHRRRPHPGQDPGGQGGPPARGAGRRARCPVVAGFQGVSAAREITTLGRGGSDATAVALAAVLDADACEIYTDVTGVFTADPRIVPEAHRINRISFEEMLEMAATGGRVLMLRAVEFARNHNVPLHVRSSFTWEPGTWVVEEDADMEEAVVTAVTHDTSEAKVTVSGVPDRPGVAARLFRALADKSINVDMIVQNTSAHGTTDISFTVPTADLPVAVETSQVHADELGASGVTADADVARVSLVGVGMKSHPGIAATMFETLANERINIDMISTSTIRTSCIVAERDVERAVRSPARGLRPGLMATKARARRTLWLLRHAKTVTDPPPGGADFDRVLAPRGRRDATALGRLFAGAGEGLGPSLKGVPRPQIALVSPAARTAATAELVLAGVTDPPQCRLEKGLYAADPEEVLDFVRSLPDEVNAAMVVGHNPTAQALSQGLLSARDKKGLASVARHGFPTCALGVYSFDVGRWADVAGGTAKLVAIMTPPYAGAS